MQIINNTGANFIIQGVTISNGGTYTVTSGQERIFAADQTLWVGLLNPSLAVSDGTNTFIDGFARDYLSRFLVENDLDVIPASQTITARDTGSSSATGQNSQAIITGTPTVSSTASFSFTSFKTGLIQVTGTWTGTLQPEISFDSGTTWYPSKISQPAINSSVTTFTGNLSGITNITGTTNFRIRATAAMTGTATVSITLSRNEYSAYINNDIVGTVTANAGTGTFTVDASGHTVPVSGTFWQATQPISGTVTANAGTGTFTVDASGHTVPVTATLSAETTKVIGTVNIAANQTVGLAAGAVTIGALAANQSVNISQVNGGTTVTSVTGVQDVMPRKRSGSSGLSPNYSNNHITSKTTVTPTSSTAYISNIVISCSNAGTSWTLKIQDKEATPLILIPAFTLAVPTTGLPVIISFTEPVLMTSGIDIVTAGTTAGTVDVFLTYWQ